MAVGLLVALVASGCGQEAPPPPAALIGVITEITAEDGGEVTGFDLDAGEESYEILIDPARDYGFDLSHLYEHQTTEDPVRVQLQQREEALYALRIDDAKPGVRSSEVVDLDELRGEFPYLLSRKPAVASQGPRVRELSILRPPGDGLGRDVKHVRHFGSLQIARYLLFCHVHPPPDVRGEAPGKAWSGV